MTTLSRVDLLENRQTSRGCIPQSNTFLTCCICTSVAPICHSMHLESRAGGTLSLHIVGCQSHVGCTHMLSVFGKKVLAEAMLEWLIQSRHITHPHLHISLCTVSSLWVSYHQRGFKFVLLLGLSALVGGCLHSSLGRSAAVKQPVGHVFHLILRSSLYAADRCSFLHMPGLEGLLDSLELLPLEPACKVTMLTKDLRLAYLHKAERCKYTSEMMNFEQGSPEPH